MGLQSSPDPVLPPPCQRTQLIDIEIHELPGTHPVPAVHPHVADLPAAADVDHV